MATADAGFFPPNHNYGLERQLNGGIRGLNIDLYWYDDQVYMCHLIVVWENVSVGGPQHPQPFGATYI